VEVHVKLLLSLITILALAVPAVADIDPIFRNPQPPQFLDQIRETQPDGPQRSILPGYPEPSVSDPVEGPPYLQPDFAPVPVKVPGRPSYEDPLKLDHTRPKPWVKDLPDGIAGNQFNERIRIDPPPIFRNQFDIQFGPEFGRLSGSVKLIGTDGRLAAEQRFSNATGVTLAAGSLPAGSYIVVVYCGPGNQFLGRSLKLD
jgi:hypothetical protein